MVNLITAIGINQFLCKVCDERCDHKYDAERAEKNKQDENLITWKHGVLY